MVKRVVSPMWEFFEKCSDSPHLVRCKIFQKTTSRGSSDPYKMTVTYLKNHREANHGDEYKKTRIQKVVNLKKDWPNLSWKEQANASKLN